MLMSIFKSQFAFPAWENIGFLSSSFQLLRMILRISSASYLDIDKNTIESFISSSISGSRVEAATAEAVMEANTASMDTSGIETGTETPIEACNAEPTAEALVE